LPKIEVVHAISPLCSWSWGYEPVLNRLRHIYGKQVEFVVGHALPYTDREEWLKDYGMTDKEAVAWQHEGIDLLGLPTYVPSSFLEMPSSCYPAAVASIAANIAHGPEAERKLIRRILFATFVEGLDTSDDKVLSSLVDELGLDNARMLKVSEGDAIDRAMGNDMARMGHGANFYSLLVRDGNKEFGNTKVSVEHGYDAARVERAIEYLSEKKLKRGKLPSIEAYVEEVGPVSIAEVSKFYAISKADAKSKLSALEKKGKLARKTYPKLPKDPFWALA
jgi:putative protein-disulfide isomerase